MKSERERRQAAAKRLAPLPDYDAHVRSWAKWGWAGTEPEVFDDLNDDEQIAVDAFWRWYERGR